MLVLWHISGGQKTAFGDRISPSTMNSDDPTRVTGHMEHMPLPVEPPRQHLFLNVIYKWFIIPLQLNYAF